METAPNAHSIPVPVSQPSAGVPHTSEEENPVVAVAVELEVPTVMTPSAVGQVRRSATQILPNLFLSDALTARWGGTLDRLKITHIISVLEEPITFPSTERPLKLLHITASDDSNTDLLSFMDQTTEFIKEAIGTNKRDQGQLDITSLSATSAAAAAATETILDGESPMSSGPARAQENTVLVHCLAGMSRSATIVIAYLIATTPMTVGEATEFVRSKRKIIRPNHGFVKQLEQYERRHFVSTGKTAAVKKRVGTDIASRIQMYQDVAAGVRRNEE